MAHLSLRNSSEMPKQGFMKDSFGFKMSKKVAELTQVVHMLFSRNHEREVELDALKTAYEQEILHVIKETRSNTERLEFLLRDTTRQRQREVVQAADNTALLLKETQERMETMKQDLIDERNQTTKFREMLAQAQKELERTKLGTSGVSETLEQTHLRLTDREAELLKLKTIHKKLQEQYKVHERELEEIKLLKSHTDDKLAESRTVVHRLNKSLDDTSRKADELSKKLLQAEEEVKFAKRELKRKSQRKNNQSSLKPALSSIPLSKQNDDKNEEIEALRREIYRLRMELSNREGNFNRVFAKFQPVVVSQEHNAQRAQSNRLMMVTPTLSELDTSRRHHHHQTNTASSARSESPFMQKAPPTAPGSHYTTFAPTVLSPPKLTNSYSNNGSPPKLTSVARNNSPQHFRLVYSK